MLIEFQIANYRSFNEKQTLSLIASKRNTKHLGNLVRGEKFDLLKSAAVYGKNASGKSNLIKAICAMEVFIANSATKMTQGDKIWASNPFRLDPKSKEQPSFFKIRIAIDGTEYEYSISVTRDRVCSEQLIAYPPPHNRTQHWIERYFDPATNKTKSTFRGPLAKHKKILEKRTRDNGLVLARGAELNIDALSKVFLWFREKLWVFDLSDQPSVLLQKTAKRIIKDEWLRDLVNKMIKHADFDIDGITPDYRTIPLEKIPENIRNIISQPFMREALGKELIGEKDVKALTIQTDHIRSDSKIEQFDMDIDESNGTKRFFALCGPFLDALRQGAVVVVDELECSMHPILTRKLVELFQRPEVNKKGAQLIFATHDSTLMDQSLFRRDQLWLVEKNRRAASELFSLYDFDVEQRPRSTEAFQRNYLAGRYGGVPKLGPIFEDLELE